jgi:putative transposase
MSKIARDPLYRRHRFPAEIISHAVWLYFRFPLSLRMVEDMLAARGIIVTHQTIRDWAEKFGRHFANEIRRRSAGRLGDKWYLDGSVANSNLRRGKASAQFSCGQDFELLGERWCWIAGVSRLSFAHHVNHLDSRQDRRGAGA